MNTAHLTYTVGHLSLVSTTFVFNLLAAKVLGPDQMGVWQTANLISIYGSIVTFGILNGMSREVPVRIGRGDALGAAEVIATTLSPLLALILVFALAGGVALAVPSGMGMAIGMGLVLLSARLFNGFSLMLIRSYQEFTRLGVHQAVSAMMLGLGTIGIWFYPTLVTVLISVSLALTVCGLLAVKHMHLRPVSAPTLRYLAGIGTPIMLAGFLFSLLTTVDRLLIVGLLGTRELGLYTPVISVLGAVMIAPGLVSNVMYPRLGQIYGESGSHVDLLPLVRRMIRLNYFATLPISAVLGVVFYFLVVPYFLPNYAESRIPLAIVLLGALFLPLGQSMGDLFNVIGWQRLYLRNMAVGMVMNGLTGYLLAAYGGLGLSGIALGSVIGMAGYALCQYLTSRRLVLQTTGLAAMNRRTKGL